MAVGERGNGVCSVGVAYDAHFAVLGTGSSVHSRLNDFVRRESEREREKRERYASLTLSLMCLGISLNLCFFSSFFAFSH